MGGNHVIIINDDNNGADGVKGRTCGGINFDYHARDHQPAATAEEDVRSKRIINAQRRRGKREKITL